MCSGDVPTRHPAMPASLRSKQPLHRPSPLSILVFVSCPLGVLLKPLFPTPMYNKWIWSLKKMSTQCQAFHQDKQTTSFCGKGHSCVRSSRRAHPGAPCRDFIPNLKGPVPRSEWSELGLLHDWQAQRGVVSREK